MKKNTCLFCLGIFLLSHVIYAQIGINTQTPNSTLEINGSFARKVTQITTTSTIENNHSIFICNPTEPIEITLTSASGNIGRLYTIKNITSFPVTVKTQSSQLIEGSNNFILQNINMVIQIVSDGNNWYILDKYLP